MVHKYCILRSTERSNESFHVYRLIMVHVICCKSRLKYKKFSAFHKPLVQGITNVPLTIAYSNQIKKCRNPIFQGGGVKAVRLSLSSLLDIACSVLLLTINRYRS